LLSKVPYRERGDFTHLKVQKVTFAFIIKATTSNKYFDTFLVNKQIVEFTCLSCMFVVIRYEKAFGIHESISLLTDST